jgi:hypothetical protein
MRDFSRPRGLGKKNALMAGQANDYRVQKGQRNGQKAREKFDPERQEPQAQEPELGESETGQGRPERRSVEEKRPDNSILRSQR